jgi:hypothetical protein
MSFEDINIVRAWPIINGYVQIPNNLPADKTRLDADDLLASGLVTDAEISSFKNGSKQDKQRIFNLKPVKPYEWYTTNPVDEANT